MRAYLAVTMPGCLVVYGLTRLFESLGWYP